MFHSIYKGNLLEGVVVSSLKKTSLGMCSVFIVEWMLTDGISLSFCFSEVLNYYKEKKVDSFHVMCQESDISLQSSIVHQFIPRKHVDIILNNSDLDEVNFNLYFGSTDAV
jgi:hypothetical protein